MWKISLQQQFCDRPVNSGMANCELPCKWIIWKGYKISTFFLPVLIGIKRTQNIQLFLLGTYRYTQRKVLRVDSELQYYKKKWTPLQGVSETCL